MGGDLLACSVHAALIATSRLLLVCLLAGCGMAVLSRRQADDRARAVHPGMCGPAGQLGNGDVLYDVKEVVRRCAKRGLLSGKNDDVLDAPTSTKRSQATIHKTCIARCVSSAGVPSHSCQKPLVLTSRTLAEH